ncbi:oligopeptide transport system permease protein AppB [Pseudovibrio sp. FO-BEG1]|uniref:Peptide/nickel transport system permease protein n=1 Tax=Pseudovibrio denitrificans TaxID=258256 RepID=A0A1I6XRV0_9HYPH|nr:MULTISPECIES: ABC transporter permease [Pseudovibrio]AEV37377.1 oligopeptide transport system permease protein AppB [Pseudovibrio sp. FO-BEG1]EEA96701.1 ABC transporter, membrane spanning protein (oligopeptide) [Pseudovibrio sp. JE062]SFT40434.1 peptide/nickel transport system permease protein [Pseudovibrio denitrificans]
MAGYIAHRLLWSIPTLIVITIATFVIIQLPPGDYVTAYIAELVETGEVIDAETAAHIRHEFGLDRPMYEQFLTWIGGILLHGDFGLSLDWKLPVSELIWDRIGLTLMISVLSLLMTWAIAIPIGVYSATRQYSFFDHLFTVLGFLGRGIPDFLLALVLMWMGFLYFNFHVGGLFSPEFENAPWSIAKFVDLLSHLWVPVLVLSTGGAAGLLRIMRANMLEELGKPYVETAYAQGLSERQVVWRYPVRVALNPFISTVGWALPALISGDVITAVVLNLPTTGPLLLRSLQNQDMYLAGGFILILSVFTIIGTLLSDILLVLTDPRIRHS